MQSDLFHCPSCKESYDLEFRIQKALSSCSHYLCLSCLRNIFANHSLEERQCPSCNVSLPSTHLTPEAFTTNFSLLAILQNNDKEKLRYCSEHDRFQELFCMTDRVPICKFCETDGNHKGHRVQSIKGLQKKTDKKKKRLKELLQDNVQKKKMREREIVEKHTKMQELVKNQFFEMRKMLHQKEAEMCLNIDNAVKAEKETLMNGYNQNKAILETEFTEASQDEYGFIITEECGNDANDFPLTEISNNQIEETFSEAQEILSRFSKTIIGSLKLEPSQIHEVSTQTVEETSKPLQHEVFTQTVQMSTTLMFRNFSKETQESISFEKEAPSPIKTNTFNIFQDDEEEEDCLALKPKKKNKVIENCDEMEEEFVQKEQFLGQNQLPENQLTKKEIQDMKNQIMEIVAEPQIKLDFSKKRILDKDLTALCSEDFWNGADKNKICRLEVDFSASSLTDQQFIKFTQTILAPTKNFTSIALNLAQTKISHKSFQVFSQQGLKNYKLKKFALNCSETSIGYEGIKHLEDGLSRSVQTLEHVEIVFAFTDLWGERSLDVLSGMNQLKNLKVSFENSQISPEIVSSLVYCLGFLAQNLESLDLNFNGTVINDENFENFSNHALLLLKKLNHLKLSLRETSLSHRKMTILFKSLESIAPHFVTFELDLSATELHDIAFDCFCEKVLSQMQNLESLNLNLGRTKITDSSLKKMKLPLHKLKNLALNLSENNIHGSSLQSFKDNNDFENPLQSFYLNVEKTFVSREALEGFLDLISKNCQNVTVLRRNQDENVPGESHQDPESESEVFSEYSSDAENVPGPTPKAKKFVVVEIPVKRKIISELREAVINQYGFKSDPTKVQMIRLSHWIQNLDLKVYENLLLKILNQNLPAMRITVKNLVEWKKRIQKWMESYGQINKKYHQICKSDPGKNIKIEAGLNGSMHWSSWLKKNGKESSFKQSVGKILQSMSFKSFSKLRQKLFNLLQKLSSENKNCQEFPKLEDNTFSSSWWYRFIDENKELGDLWRKLPLPHLVLKEEYIP